MHLIKPGQIHIYAPDQAWTNTYLCTWQSLDKYIFMHLIKPGQIYIYAPDQAWTNIYLCTWQSLDEYIFMHLIKPGQIRIYAPDQAWTNKNIFMHLIKPGQIHIYAPNQACTNTSCLYTWSSLLKYITKMCRSCSANRIIKYWCLMNWWIYPDSFNIIQSNVQYILSSN